MAKKGLTEVPCTFQLAPHLGSWPWPSVESAHSAADVGALVAPAASLANRMVVSPIRWILPLRGSCSLATVVTAGAAGVV